jgi:hypothetical protein
MPAILEFRYNSTFTDHEDVFLSFEGIERTCDSFWLWHIDPLAAERCEPLRGLLERWKNDVLRLEDGCSAYLWYDFSDEYAAGLRCTRNGEDLMVVDGYSESEGCGGSDTYDDIDFTVRGNPALIGDIEIRVSALVEKIDEAISLTMPRPRLLTRHESYFSDLAKAIPNEIEQD